MEYIDTQELAITPLDSEELMQILNQKTPMIAAELTDSGIMEEELIFYKASYHYGSNIVYEGDLKFCLKNGNEISINDKSFPVEIREAILGNNGNADPLALVIDHAAEKYLYKDQAIHKESILYPGDFIGLPKSLDPENQNRSSILSYNISSGARSTFILQKISNKQTYQTISRSIGANIYFPKSYEEHWKTFASIAQKSNSNWSCEVIFFPRKFIAHISNKKYASLYVYLNKLYTKSYGIKHRILNLWKLIYFSTIENNRHLQRYSSAYIDVIKHIFMVATKDELAFKVASDDMLLPLGLIEDFFKNHYGISNPCIVEPTYFDYTLENQSTVYISLGFEVVMSTLINNSSKKTKITLLEEIKQIFDKHLDTIANENLLQGSLLENILKQIKFTYFHNSHDIKVSKYILMIEDIVANDKTLKEKWVDDEALRSSSFFAGGMSLSIKSET